MLYEENYLAHYGIKLQRWGVRRFQNADGSLTIEGKERYYGFKKTEDTIRRKLSNSYSRFNRKPIDIKRVCERGNLTSNEARECSLLSKNIFERAFRVEPSITEDVVSSVDSVGAKMYGLENRIKQPTSIAAKIGADAKASGCSFEEAASNIKDTIRYTAISDSDKFVENYFAIKDELERKGYFEVRCKNFFQFFKDGFSKHKAVQCVYSDPSGNVFELQFHTPSSQAAKELKIPLYEEIRKTNISQRRIDEIEQQMMELADRVSDPAGVFKIQSH